MIKAILISLLISISGVEQQQTSSVNGYDASALPRVMTNQSFIEELIKKSELDTDNPRAVLSLILNSMPDVVDVYPTENYYYFRFYQDGVGYAGNIRLDAADRDEGVIHFTYFQESHDRFKIKMHTIHPGQDDGLLIERVSWLNYKVRFDGKETMFKLNDLSDVRPSQNHIGPDETYIGPIFDESGIQFFLLFNRIANVFLYVLNDTASVPDQMLGSAVSPHIQIGVRTRFAFYKDLKRQRSILIGVPEQHVRDNNYYDGPFDQLPDNFIDGETFSDAFRLSRPEFPFAIDRFGRTSSTTRVLIRPYALYNTESDLQKFDRCAILFQHMVLEYYKCFDVDD